MLLREVHLTNVGLYAGTQVVRLSTDPTKPITLIGGRNGAGKTTLLEAIPLALYGIRARQVLGARSYARHLDGLISDGASKASVRLVFDRRMDGRDVTYDLDRTWRASSHGQARDRLDVRVDGSPRPDLQANWSEYVERILPLSLSGLAMFDGEKIEALANVESANDVLRASLYGLLGLDVVEQLRTDLVEFRRKRARAADTTDELRNALSSAEANLAAAVERHDGLQSDLDAARDRHASADRMLNGARDRLSKSGGDLYARREELHAQRAELREQRAAFRGTLIDLARGDLPLLVAGRLLKRVAEVGNASATAGEARFLSRHLKERDTRICSELENHPKISKTALAIISSLLDNDRSAYERESVVPFELSETAGSSAVAWAEHGLDDLRRTLSATLASIANIDGQLGDIDASLAKVPDEKSVGDLVRAVADAEAHMDEAARELVRLEEETAKAGRLVESLGAKLDQASQRIIDAEGSAADDVRTAREVDRAQATLEQFQIRIVAKNVDRIRTNVLESFRSLIRKETLITDLTIDPETLAIGLFGHDGRALDPDRLSAGERQTLATALLWGLSKSTGRTLPTIIDTPVGRLDSSHRKKLVTGYFPNASRQVVLLSTDEEVVAEYRDAIAGRVGAEYLLDFDPETNSTTVREGYFA
jgi:DNA sulfur modification protein DndD